MFLVLTNIVFVQTLCADVVEELRKQIAAKQITFDEAKMEKELLGENTGTKVTGKLSKARPGIVEIAENQN
jgi:hypothetical protein